MAQTTVTPPVRSRLTRNDLTQRGALAVGIAVVSIAIARGIIGAFLAVPATFNPLLWGELIFVTAVAAILASIVYALVDRYTERVNRNFLIIAAVVFVLSFIPLVFGAVNLPGATATLITLTGVLHFIVAVTVTGALLRGREMVRM